MRQTAIESKARWHTFNKVSLGTVFHLYDQFQNDIATNLGLP